MLQNAFLLQIGIYIAENEPVIFLKFENFNVMPICLTVQPEKQAGVRPACEEMADVFS